MSSSPENDGWDTCPNGELHTMVSQLRSQQRRHSIGRAVVTVGLLLMVVLGVAYINPLSVEPAGGIACDEVQKALSDYVAGSLAPVTRESIDIHLKACLHCREHYAQVEKQVVRRDLVDRYATWSPRLLLASRLP